MAKVIADDQRSNPQGGSRAGDCCKGGQWRELVREGAFDEVVAEK